MSKTKTQGAILATNSNHNEVGSNSLYAWRYDLILAANGKHALTYHCGVAMQCKSPRSLTRKQAVDWIATEAIDPITGYGYTREQAEIMVDGADAGRGYRD
jgi:hypothetical protein